MRKFVLIFVVITCLFACSCKDSENNISQQESSSQVPSDSNPADSFNCEQLIEPKNWQPKPGGIVTYPVPLNSEDGTLFGYVLSFDSKSNILVFDPAEWWTAGDDMEKLAELELDAQSLPSGFYVFNPRVEEWAFAVAPDAQIRLLQPPNYNTEATETKETLYQRVGSSAYYMSVHITIKNNQVVSLTEQYRP